jgi:hypothetical protein
MINMITNGEDERAASSKQQAASSKQHTACSMQYYGLLEHESCIMHHEQE